MTCKDCLHYEVCVKHYTQGQLTMINGDCSTFADRSEWIHLSCKVGDTVYYITGIHNSLVGSERVEEIYYNGDGFAYRACTNNDVRFDVQEEETYYTREEAEKALERS